MNNTSEFFIHTKNEVTNCSACNGYVFIGAKNVNFPIIILKVQLIKTSRMY